MRTMAMFLVAMMAWIVLCGAGIAADGQVGQARSPDGRAVAYAAPRGEPKALLTEIWIVNEDDTIPRRIRTFLGPPGDIWFTPDGEGIVYRQRGLSHTAFGSYLCGGREVPLVRDRAWRMAADGSDVSPWVLSEEDVHLSAMASSPVDSATTVVRPVDFEGALSPAERQVTQGALSGIDSALRLCAKTRQMARRGDFPAARRAYKAAARAFDALHRRYRKAGISEVDCRGYAEALDRCSGMDDDAHRQAVCRERVPVLGDLIRFYAQEHGDVLPSSLDTLYMWMEGRVDAEPDADARARDMRVLPHLFHCALDPDEAPHISFVYRPEASGDAPVLRCLWHRGAALNLVGQPEGFGLEARALSAAQVDSLAAAADTCLAAGDMARAILLLGGVAQQRGKDADAYTRLGHAYLKVEDCRHARWAFETAAHMSRGETLSRAYYGLGLVCVATQDLGAAVTYFRDAATRDRSFLEARYQVARTRYLLREYDAKRDIEKVLKIDSTYAPAQLLMGDWYADFQEDYAKAIPWYLKYIASRPDDPEGRRKLSIAYLEAEDYEGILNVLLEFIKANPNALDLLPIVAQACVKQEQYGKAMSFHMAYLSRIPEEERALYQGISLIATDDEIAEYEAASGDERQAFLRRFWNDRDPDLSTPANERLLEHYRRVWVARQRFSGGKQPWDRRGEVYVRFGEPDHRTTSQMMNAEQSMEVQRIKEQMARALYRPAAPRGRDPRGDFEGDVTQETFLGPVYPIRSLSARILSIRGGFRIGYTGLEGIMERIDQLRNQAEGEENPGILSEIDAAIAQEQIQLDQAQDYNVLGGRLGVGQQDKPPDRHEYRYNFGEYGPVVASASDASRVGWECWVYTRIGGGIEITFTDENINGVFDYAPIPSTFEIDAEFLTRLGRYAPAAVVEKAVSVSPDYYVPEFAAEPFDFYFDVAAFRGRDGRTALEVYYGMPGTAARYVDTEDVTQMVVDRRVALAPAGADTVYRRAGDLVWQVAGYQRRPGMFVPDMERVDLPPGSYRLEVRARDRLGGKLGIYRKALTVEAYGTDSLQVSDLQLAWQIAPSPKGEKFRKGDLLVVPMPTRTYRVGQGVFVYYEVYNLKRDAFGQTRYEVAYTIRRLEGSGGVIARLVQSFAGGKEEVAVGYEQVGLAASEPVHVELDLGEQNRPGR